MSDLFVRPPKTLLRQAGRAIADFSMIRDGDRILLGLSGGKDSLTLLHTLIHFQKHAPITFDLAAATVNPLVDGFDPTPLADYCKQLNIPYFAQKENMEALAKSHMDKNSFCSFCSRIRRGVLYKLARDNQYNALALAQHLDDLAESFLMSAFHGGKIQTMKAHYQNDKGDVRVIRPFVYCRERQLADFALDAKLPVIMDNCPACFEKPTQREHMKQLLATEEQHNKNLFKNLLATLKPVMAQGVDATASK
jgi:tRNA 2-thiocytidine biosynthesis protein TtcA